jgi:hypothetical protein
VTLLRNNHENQASVINEFTFTEKYERKHHEK